MENLRADIKPEILDTFHAIWNHFPFPVMLLKKDHTILATNKSGEGFGVQTGRKCFQLSSEVAPHKGCKAAQALKSQECQRSVDFQPAMNKVLDTFWIPFAAEGEMFIHFSIDITDYAKPELFAGLD